MDTKFQPKFGFFKKNNPERNALEHVLKETKELIAVEKERDIVYKQSDAAAQDYLDRQTEKKEAIGAVATKQAEAKVLATEANWQEILERVKELDKQVQNEEQLDIPDEMRILLENVDEKKLKKHLKRLIKDQNAELMTISKSFALGSGTTAIGLLIFMGILGFGPWLPIIAGAAVAVFPLLSGHNSEERQKQARELQVRFLHELMQEGLIDEATVKKLQKT